MRGQGKQWQGQFQFPISLQIEVNRGAQRLNEDIAASDQHLSAPPVYQQVTMKGMGTGFHLEEMKICMGKKLREMIKQLIKSFP